jgi:hypothetical protein
LSSERQYFNCIEAQPNGSQCPCDVFKPFKMGSRMCTCGHFRDFHGRQPGAIRPAPPPPPSVQVRYSTPSPPPLPPPKKIPSNSMNLVDALEEAPRGRGRPPKSWLMASVYILVEKDENDAKVPRVATKVKLEAEGLGKILTFVKGRDVIGKVVSEFPMVDLDAGDCLYVLIYMQRKQKKVIALRDFDDLNSGKTSSGDIYIVLKKAPNAKKEEPKDSIVSNSLSVAAPQVEDCAMEEVKENVPRRTVSGRKRTRKQTMIMCDSTPFTSEEDAMDVENVVASHISGPPPLEKAVPAEEVKVILNDASPPPLEKSPCERNFDSLPPPLEPLRQIMVSSDPNEM